MVADAEGVLPVMFLDNVAYRIRIDSSTDVPIYPAVDNVTTFGGGVDGTEPEYNAGNSGTALTIDWDNGPQQRVTLTGNCTFTFAGGIAGQALRLILVEDAIGGRTATFPANVKFESGSAPAIITTANNVIFFAFVKTTVGAGGFLGFATLQAIAQP